MKRKTKILISALSVMFVAAIAVAIASFSFAGDGDKDALQEGTQYVASAGEIMGNDTIIDYIIRNSNSTDPEVDKVYHIAEITSSTASTLDSYVSSNAFKNYVIDGNRTINDLMAEGCVEYKSFRGDVTDEASLAYISNADLIYVSNDSASKFTKTNDLSEKVYDILHEYAVGGFKPLIIDSPKTTTIDNSETSKTMTELAQSVFGPNEKYYYTFRWPIGISATEYLSHTSGSLYLGINGKTQSDNGVWVDVSDTDPATVGEGTPLETFKLAKILTITTNGSKAKTTDLLTDCDVHTDTLYDAIQGNVLDTTGSTVYELKDASIMYQKGYNSRVIARPKYIQNDVVTLTAAETVDFDAYDMIVIEDSCFGQTIANTLYKKFAAAMYGKIHIVYGAEMGTESSSSIDVPDDLKETNYSELFYMVATLDYTARYENIMVTNRADFSLITTSASAQTAKVIADLINASKYRGIGGRGSSGSMFTVLEIQPCYPIDEAVAVYNGTTGGKPRSSKYSSVYGSGNYYTVPADVVNGKTKEQLPENTEYYAWELSKAKIADALNLSVDQINLVQMSSEEFACDKAEVLGNYDLIYIGGNTTALKSREQYRSLTGLATWGTTIGDHSPNVNLARLNELPIYTMYSHTGDMVNLDLSAMAESPGPANSGTPTAKVKLNGSYVDTFAVLNGNDISYSRCEALMSYINKGMPIVISKDLTQAYTIAKTSTNPYLQNSIDPDSNMYKILKACDTRTEAGKTNVLWSFDSTAVESILSDGTYGDSVSGYVSVFQDAQKTALNTLYATSSMRPKLTLTSMPATYNRFDDSSKLTDGILKFKYTVKGSSDYTVKLYIDDNGNSSFDRTEEYMGSGDKTALTYACATNFYGPLYWMIEVQDKSSGLTVSQTGIAYVKNKTEDRQPVSVLQIMPGTQKYNPSKAIGEGAEGYNSLYFCTVCQQCYQRLEYNPYSNAGSRNGYGALYGGNFFDSADGKVGSHYLGKHEHTFGIVSYDSGLEVPKKDSNGNTIYGMDDWDNNLADQVSDLYDFDIDIMLRNEFEQVANDVENAYIYKVDDDGNITTTAVTDAEKLAVVNTFAIDTNDTEFAYYQALRTVDEKYEFIMKRQYSQLAGKYWQLYQYMSTQSAVGSSSTMKDETGADITKTTVDAQKELDEMIDKLIAGVQAGPINGGTTFSDPVDELVSELKRLKTLGHYSDYYSINNNAAVYNDVSKAYLPGSASIDPYFDTYFKTKDKELEYKELYKKYSRYAAGSDWMQECYSAVILGPSEDFGGDDITDPYALADFASYIEDDGVVLLFHDTLTKFSDAGSSVLTKTLRPYFGMDRYNMNDPVTTKADEQYVNYTTKYDSDVYFMTNLSTKPKTDDTRYASWLSDMKQVFGSTPSKYLTSVAYTDAVNVSGSSNPYAIPYKYADLSWSIAGFWYNAASFSAKENTKYGTDKASQNNKGIVTLFPFTLSSELNISGTHSQAYALDIEDEDMTVWYSLAGGNNTKDGSSIYAASPRDGMDSYFVYSYKNVNYCGAGHSKVTGVGKENNDERYLYINIICNSVRNSVKQPTIYVYDYGKETNEIIKRDVNDDYYTKVDEMTEYPEFSFKVSVDKDATLTNVRIFYDLDYSDTNHDNAYTANNNHVLIADWDSTIVESGVIKDVFRYDASLEKLVDASGNQIAEKYIDAGGNEITVAATKLKLQPEYFAPYNNEYTYIVIEATDSEGNKVYQRIKVMLKDYLFDLT